MTVKSHSTSPLCCPEDIRCRCGQRIAEADLDASGDREGAHRPAIAAYLKASS